MNITDYLERDEEHVKTIAKLTTMKDAAVRLLTRVENNIKAHTEAETDRAVNKLLNDGWKKFVFISNDVEFSVMKIEISFIFNKDISIEQFSNAEFRHGTGNFRPISFSKKKLFTKMKILKALKGG